MSRLDRSIIAFAASADALDRSAAAWPEAWDTAAWALDSLDCAFLNSLATAFLAEITSLLAADKAFLRVFAAASADALAASRLT